MHKTLFLAHFHTLYNLSVLRSAECEYREYVRGPAIEDTRTVHNRRKVSSLREQRTNLIKLASVRPAIISDGLLMNEFVCGVVEDAGAQFIVRSLVGEFICKDSLPL